MRLVDLSLGVCVKRYARLRASADRSGVPAMPAPVPGRLHAGGVPRVLGGRGAEQRPARLLAHAVASARTPVGKRASPVYRSTARRPRPPDLPGRGRNADHRCAVSGQGDRAAAHPGEGRAAEPDRKLARPLHGGRHLPACRRGRPHCCLRRQRLALCVDGGVRGAGGAALCQPGRQLARGDGRACAGRDRRRGRQSRGRRRLRGAMVAARPGRAEAGGGCALLPQAGGRGGWRAMSTRATPPIGGDPLGIEGYKTIAYEIVEQLGFNVPDLVAVPAGLGDGIQGIWRGFRELANWGVVDAYPRMVAVEVGGALASALAGGRDWVEPSGETTTEARALAGVTGTVQALNAVTESEGLVVRVIEPELDAARLVLGEQEGIWADLSAAAPIAAAQKLASRGDVPARMQIVCVVTEPGLLDDSTVAPGTLQTVDARVDDLLRILAVRGE